LLILLKNKWKVEKTNGFEHNHPQIIQVVNEQKCAFNVSVRFYRSLKSRHKSVGVMLTGRCFGLNDGMVSTMSLQCAGSGSPNNTWLLGQERVSTAVVPFPWP
jgi:hypothetical protein